jgi:hypothetical protein
MGSKLNYRQKLSALTFFCKSSYLQGRVTYKLSTEEIFKAKDWSWLHKNNTLSPLSCFAAKINKEYCARSSLCEAHLLPLLNIFWFGVSGTHELTLS